MKKIYPILALFLLTSCGLDDLFGNVVENIIDCTAENIEKEKKIQEIKEKYENEKSAENCKEYKKVLKDYLEFAKNCIAEEALKDYKEIYKNLNCE